MASYNRVLLLGNLTRDPESRFTPNGTAVTDIGLALNDKRKGANGEWIEECTFVDVTLWGRTAEVAVEYLRKGAQVLIEGRLKLDQWDDKNGGGKRQKLKVVGERLTMVGSKPGGEGGQRGGRQQGGYQSDEYGQPSNDNYDQAPPARSSGGDEEIPF